MSGKANGQKLIPATIEDNTILATGPSAISIYNKGSYGTPEAGGVRLNGFEALHLLELQRIEIIVENQLLNPAELTKILDHSIAEFMLRYMVYKDLRTRGYIVNQGKGSSFFFRLYDRNTKPGIDSAKYYVRPLNEGRLIPLQSLEDLIEIASKSQKDLLLGMVDAVGDVSYLKVNKMVMNKIDNLKIKPTDDWNWHQYWQESLDWE